MGYKHVEIILFYKVTFIKRLNEKEIARWIDTVQAGCGE